MTVLASSATRGSVGATTYPLGASSQAIGGASAPPNATAYSGTFIPEIWSGKLLAKFYDASVFAAISNTDYEGEIRNMGDTVHIRTRPTINILDYTPDAELLVQRPNADIVDFQIEYAKYFSFILDDIWDVQSDIDMMNLWSEDASEQLKITIDTELLAGVVLGSAHASNKGATAGRISGDVNLGVTLTPLVVAPETGTGIDATVIDLLVNMGQVLDEQNIPESGRWVVIPAWLAAMIKKSELRDASVSGDGVSMLRNGRLGMIDRFTLYMSNLLPAGVAGGLAAGETAIFAGHSLGITFASQLTKMETMRSERTFGQLMRGLNVYGAKTLKTEAICEAVIAKS